jgi:beta-lactamase class A
MELEALQQQIEAIVSDLDGLMGVCVRDYTTGQEIGVRLDEPLPMASTCKIPILVSAYRQVEAGALDLSARIEITDETRTWGSGLFNAFDTGLKPTLHDLLLMMIVVSDNAATDLVLSQLPAGFVTATMQELGLQNIHCDRTIQRLIGDFFAALDPRLAEMKFGEWDVIVQKYPELKQKGEDLTLVREAVNVSASVQDTASVRDMARLCGQIASNSCASEASCEAMLEIMDRQVLNGRLPRHLPPFTRFPHKTGTLGSGAVVNDAGILYLQEKPAATIAVLSRDMRSPIMDTETAMARIGRCVYDYYKLAAS